jgi:hypothetical protein
VADQKAGSQSQDSGEFKVLMLKIREADMPRALEAIEKLGISSSSESEVQGYAFGRQPTIGGIGGPGGINRLSGTQCKTTGGALSPDDFNCGDDD